MPTENYCDFTVYISEHGARKGLIVEATTMDTEVAFNNVTCVDDMAKARSMNKFERSMLHYNGPDFTTLDERI